MLRATQSGRLYHAPTDEDGEDLFDHSGFREPLTYEAGEEFDIREKVPLDFADLSPQQAGKLRKKVERELAAQNAHFELIDEDEDEGGDDETDGDTDTDSEEE